MVRRGAGEGVEAVGREVGVQEEGEEDLQRLRLAGAVVAAQDQAPLVEAELLVVVLPEVEDPGPEGLEALPLGRRRRRLHPVVGPGRRPPEVRSGASGRRTRRLVAGLAVVARRRAGSGPGPAGARTPSGRRCTSPISSSRSSASSTSRPETVRGPPGRPGSSGGRGARAALLRRSRRRRRRPAPAGGAPRPARSTARSRQVLGQQQGRVGTVPGAGKATSVIRPPPSISAAPSRRTSGLEPGGLVQRRRPGSGVWLVQVGALGLVQVVQVEDRLLDQPPHQAVAQPPVGALVGSG